MNRHLILKASLTGALLLAPFAAFAQDLGNINRLIAAIQNIVNTLLPILVTIALLVFFWGLIKYIREANNPEAANEGKSIMIAGIIALFVMVSVWGIVGFIGRALNIERGGSIPVPGVDRTPGVRGSGGSTFGTSGSVAPGQGYYSGQGNQYPEIP